MSLTRQSIVYIYSIMGLKQESGSEDECGPWVELSLTREKDCVNSSINAPGRAM